MEKLKSECRAGPAEGKEQVPPLGGVRPAAPGDRGRGGFRRRDGLLSGKRRDSVSTGTVRDGTCSIRSTAATPGRPRGATEGHWNTFRHAQPPSTTLLRGMRQVTPRSL